jgi:hypothetical protein
MIANPTLNKRILQLFVRSVAAYDLSTGQAHEMGGVVRGMKSAIVLLEFYATYRNFIFWIHPFSKETIDRDKLVQTLMASLTTHTTSNVGLDYGKVAQKVVDQLMKEQCYSSRGEVLTALRGILGGYQYEPKQIDNIMRDVVVQQKARSKRLLLMMACFTLADLGGNWATLRQRGAFDAHAFSTFLKFASLLGNRVPILQKFMVMAMNRAIGQVIGTLASIGLSLALVEASYRLVDTYTKSQLAQSEQEGGKTQQEFKTACYDVLSTAIDLFCVAIPLLWKVSPGTGAFLGVVSKGTGSICLLLK